MMRPYAKDEIRIWTGVGEIHCSQVLPVLEWPVEIKEIHRKGSGHRLDPAL